MLFPLNFELSAGKGCWRLSQGTEGIRDRMAVYKEIRLGDLECRYSAETA
jgi:hypothetical protein